MLRNSWQDHINWVNTERKVRTDINSPGGHRSASHWDFDMKNPAIHGCLCRKSNWFYLSFMEGCFLVAIPLIWEFLHLYGSLVWIRICICLSHLKLQLVLGLAAITTSYWLCWWLISLYLPCLLLPQIAPYSNWGHKIMFPSPAAFLLVGFFPPASLDLPWLFFGALVSVFLLSFNLFPCN